MTRPLTRSEEKKLLLEILGLLRTNQPPGILARLKWNLFSWGLGLVIAIVVLATVIEPSIYKVLLTCISFAAGLCLGSVTSNLAAVRRWPALSRCIDSSKVEARLREIDA